MNNITPGHVRAFHMLTSRRYEDNISLWSCTIDGERGVAIVLADEVAEGKIGIMPLFVAITPKMHIAFEDEQSGDGEGGGGPKDPRAAFAANKVAVTRPAPH